MFKEIFLFELSYRKSRSATYIYFGITFLLCFLGVASSIIKLGGAVGMIKANAPYVIYRMTLVSSFVLSIITSAVMGVAIVRDFDHHVDGLLFSAPIKKSGYLMGRFLGSFVTLLFINLALPLGFISGFWIGKYVPWEVAWKSQVLLPFDLWNYLHPFFLILVPNLFVTSALFFMSGALGRKSIIIYMQGVLLLVLYQIGNGYLRDLDSQYIAAIIDPFGIQTFLYTTRYWTPSEQNTWWVAFEGPMLYNRILWVSVGLIALFLTYRFFSFNVVSDSSASKKKKPPAADLPDASFRAVPKVRQAINANAYLKQIQESSFLYFKMIAKEIPFIAIAGSGILLFFLNASRLNSVYGTSSYPTTALILDVINNSFSLFFLIIVIFYSGELVWKERSVGFNMIVDALPVPSFVSLLSKFIGLLLIYAALILLLIGCGVVFQVSSGYFRFDLPVYFQGLLGSTFAGLFLLTLLSFFIQVMVNNKFAGFVVSIVFLIINALLPQLGIEHDLWQFGSGNLGPFSEINAYGHFVTPFVWFKTYWIAFSLILFVIAVVFSQRGAETLVNLRWQSGKARFTKPLLLFSATVTCIFLFSGFYIYYNTNIINKFEGSEERAQQQADYEKSLNRYQSVIQPKIVEANINVDLFPSTRDFKAEGYYYLKNKSKDPIPYIHVQYTVDDQFQVDYLGFDRQAKIKEGYPRFRYYLYELSDALLPGDSVKMSFTLSFNTRGFVEGGSHTDIVYNGTLFNNTYFPSLGYNDHLELNDRDQREKYGLKDKGPIPQRDPKVKAFDVVGHGTDRIRFEMIVSTAGDQTAIAPGYLQRAWKKDNRNYFHYKTDVPICNFYSVVSGRYNVRRERWKNVNLEIYYHPGHEFNLGKMMKGMKDALDYCADHFGPFPFRQLRVLEFPRYQTFAQSYAGTIPYSEVIGFILKVRHPEKDPDMAYYVTAHEVARQWWGQQVIGATTRGSTLLSEGMSQYSALMVMKHSFSNEIAERYLKYELDNYLKGRTLEKRSEPTLLSVEQQSYVYNNKSSLIFFALQDYLGEDKLNSAFSAFNKRWAFNDSPRPSSRDLMNEIRKVTPDSLLYLLEDMFETVTLFENQSLDAVYKEDKKGRFELTLSVSCEKIRVDSVGQESHIPIHDWVDVGVYTTDDQGKEKLIYLQKHKITKKNNLFVISTREKPSRAGIDPLHKLIDRHSDDNIIAVGQFIEITNLPVE